MGTPAIQLRAQASMHTKNSRKQPRKASPPSKIALPELFKLFKFVHFIKKTAFTASFFVTSWS